jgi:hypothetical protein
VQSEGSNSVLGLRWLRWVLLLGVTLIALASVLVPALQVQPFKLQTPERLKISFALRQWSPVITLVALAVALLIGSCCGIRLGPGGVNSAWFPFSSRSW